MILALSRKPYSLIFRVKENNKATMAIPDTEVERQIQQMIQFIDHEADEKEVEILAKVRF